MTQIKFGTDGWRGLIADDFTFANVRSVAGAIASYVLKNEDPLAASSSAMTRVSCPTAPLVPSRR
jgi:phosphomannomutase